MALTNRLLSAAVLSAAILLNGSAGFCKAKPVPKDKPAANVASSITWVTKTDGRFTYDVPSNWKQSDDGWWYAGSYPVYDAAFECSWAPPGSHLPPGDIKRKAHVTYSNIPATQYFIEYGMWDCTGILVASDSPESDGKKLMISATSKSKLWKQNEPILRKILASLRVAPARDEWVEKTYGRFTFSVPADWKKCTRLGFNVNDGSYESPDGTAIFACGWLPAGILKNNTWADGPQNVIGDLAATETWNKDVRAGRDGNICVIANTAEPDGSRAMITLMSPSFEMKRCEPVLRKILATVKVRPALAPVKTQTAPEDN